jgi:serine/threonine protein kinase
MKGDARYASPEMVNNLYYGLRHDVWGLGILTYFLFCGNFPYDGETDEEISEKIKNEEPDWEIFYKRHLNPKIISFMQGMLIKEPGKRFTIKQAMASPIFEYLEKATHQVVL